ncbi:hypothetical protein [Nonomuraea solani]|uniref:hypothetical protein n=1 Tax=Nonomuraea solani TaxID=1144553 RepID=UPI0011AFF21E|nr:hypothetical protein [Nonomuraea solani]
MATLTAGVSWLATGLAAAKTCPNTEPALLSPTSIAAYCDEHANLRVNDGGPGSSRMVTSQSSKLAMAAGDMARQLGLTGLATGKSALGVADLGGMAATWGMPSLASASPSLFPMVPGPIGMKDLSTMAGMPALPALPELPDTPLTAKLPAEMTLGQAPYHNRIAGSGIQSPMDVERPVREVSEDVVSVLLPKVAESIEGSSMLPGGEVISGFGGLVTNLGLN